jgi:hypothetical protein
VDEVPDFSKIKKVRSAIEILNFDLRKAQENNVTAVVRIKRQRRIL